MSLAHLVQLAGTSAASLGPKTCGQHRGAAFRAPAPTPRVEIPSAYGARTAAVLKLLREGPATTPELARALGMTTHAVSCLLKHCKQRGQVLRVDGKWLINPEHQPTAVTRAAALLRRLGWTVTPPVAT